MGRSLLPCHTAAAFAALAGIAFSLPIPSLAQDRQPGPQLVLNRVVSVTINNEKMRQALISLFDAAHENYSIDPAVEKGTVSLSLNNVSFRAALETILRSSPVRLTYLYENGIFTVKPSKDAAVEIHPIRTLMIPGSSLQTSASDIVRRVRSLPRWKPDSEFTYQADDHSNSIIVHYRSDDAGEANIQEFRTAVRMLDIPAQKVNFRAEVVLLVTDPTGHSHRTVLSDFGRTVSEHPITLSTSIEDAQAGPGIRWNQGQYTMHVQPVVNGDHTVSLQTSGELSFTYSLPGAGKPIRLHKEFSGSSRATSGSTITLTTTNFKAGDRKNASAAELLVFLTPTLPDLTKQTNQPGVTPSGIDPTR